MLSQTENIIEAFDWKPQPEAAVVIGELLRAFSGRCSAVRTLADDLHRKTSTRLVDWIDHCAIPVQEDFGARLSEAGFVSDDGFDRVVLHHPGGFFPEIELHDRPTWRLVITVDSVADFLAAQHTKSETPIEGNLLGQLRKARVASEGGTELWVVERHGYRGWDVPSISPDEADAVRAYRASFRRRKRDFEDAADGLEHGLRLIRRAANDLGVDWACDLFFAAEREYWTHRNRAARTQKARQDTMGLGWANHDHHTYRSSRSYFNALISVFEALGLECRERFYAGSQAGWGAQVLEQPEAGVVVFADVDLVPDEVSGDFAHAPLPPTDQLGTVGLWCRLHGEAFLQAGMHHLECRFDFTAARHQLLGQGIRCMPPFTDLAYLKQAFTEAEIWPVTLGRIEAALACGSISQQQAEGFRRSGAIGSHLEILQRDQGYKGFNMAGINEIIRNTDPRR